jgi:hypothetical protein
MSGGEPAGARRCTARRIAKYLAVATALTAAPVFATPAAARAETTYPPRITIPPARLPPPPVTAAAPSVAAMEARALLPAKMRLVRDPDDTGAAMHGTLDEKAVSASSVIAAVLAKADVFEVAPAPLLVLADPTDRRAEALFTGVMHGAPVIGVALATRGDVTLVYDDADAFAASFANLRQAFAADGSAIGSSDNSVADADMTVGIEPSRHWEAAIAAAAKAGEAPIDHALAESLARDLGNGTAPWRIIPLSELKSELK